MSFILICMLYDKQFSNLQIFLFIIFLILFLDSCRVYMTHLEFISTIGKLQLFLLKIFPILLLKAD